MTPSAPDRAPDRYWSLFHTSELAEGQVRGFDPERSGQDVLFVLRHDGQLHGWANACPHLGVPMAWRRHAHLNAAATHVQCHAHGALFEKASGLCVQGPCRGQSLRRWALVVDSAGQVLALKATCETTTQKR
jgi:nitrite reductase/ring-hydroxylating ferredoxin subunit